MPNRLAHTQSLYLRKHADNPIDWWPWCDEALAQAEEDDKPIFLSIGYSSCHWCTVMEGEAFSDPAVAAYMNDHFLPIKVDREERPDLDSIYMQALQMMTGQGGWPLNVFLSPTDRVPFFGGTYFPLEPKYGRPGFLQVLQALRNFYDHEKEKLASVKAEILENLQPDAFLSTDQDLSQSRLEQGLITAARILIPSGYGTCFPMIPYSAAALRGLRFSERVDNAPDIADICRQRGLDLALGGIYDHVGGGFHRYTVDPTWTVPHFEKMLYDNGQIMEYLADLWSLGLQEPAFEAAIIGTVQWIMREMMGEGGYFFAAQDADSFVTTSDAEPEEGAFYVWDREQVRSHLTPSEWEALQTAFKIPESGNFEGLIVLQRQQTEPLNPTAVSAIDKLFYWRYRATDRLMPLPPARNNQEAKQIPWPGRIPPVTDTKMIVAWNSLMISGLARAAVVFQQADYLQLAAQASRFILGHQWVGDRFHRLNYDGEVAVLAQSEDFALFIKALLDVQQATLAFPERLAIMDWLQAALDVQAEFDQWLWDEAAGGYYNTARDASASLIVRERTFQDSATPAANGIAVSNLVRLALLTEDLKYLDRAEQVIHAFGAAMEQMPRACPSLFAGLDWFRHATLIRTTPDRIPELMRAYLPTAVFAIDPTLADDTMGLVCRGLTCLKPATSLAQLQEQIQSSLQRA